jgi:hypothetical protein
MRFASHVALATLLSCVFTLPVNAQDAADGATNLDQNVFMFGGQMARSHMGEMFLPIGAEYEDNYVAGAGYQHFVLELPHDIRVGYEVGAALRFGETDSAEAWAGAVIRYEGLETEDGLRLTPALTAGISAVSQTMGKEAEREAGDGRSAQVLFYLSPELSISHRDNPQTEFFWRLHHRSSGWRTLGGGSANATTVGLRHHF